MGFRDLKGQEQARNGGDKSENYLDLPLAAHRLREIHLLLLPCDATLETTIY